MKYKYILWDWNGTLLDDIGASLQSVNDMMYRRNRPPMDINYYKEIIGVPIRKFYERSFDLSVENYDQILKEYNDGYIHHLSNCTLSNGVIDMLEFFNKEGCTQLIVSSSNNQILTNNVKKYGIFNYFDAILGADGFLAESKIERAKNYLNQSEKGNSLVIGDLVHDYEMAQEIGADCVLVTSGHEKLERILDSGAKVVDKLLDIIELTK